LSVPENLLGRKVKCPTCQTTFTAEASGSAPPPAPREEERPARRSDVQDRPSRRRDEDEDDRPARRRDDDEDRPARRRDEEDEDRPSRRRRRDDADWDDGGGYRAPHRGGTILTLGIVSIFPGAFCCPLAGIICGIIAIVMANGDMTKIDAGEMDPS